MIKHKSHSFDVQIAMECGIVAAVLMESFYFWIDKNRSDGTHFHDGRYWTFSSVKALLTQYPYLTRDKINSAIKKLVKRGLLLEGSYSENPYDRTKWYSLTDEGLSYYETVEEKAPENPKSSNGKSEMYIAGKSEMNIYNSNNNNIITDTKEVTSNISEKLNEAVQEWLQYKKEKKQSYQATGKKNLIKKITSMAEEYGEDAVISEIHFAMENNYQGIVWDRVKNNYKHKPKRLPEPDFMPEPIDNWSNF